LDGGDSADTLRPRRVRRTRCAHPPCRVGSLALLMCRGLPASKTSIHRRRRVVRRAEARRAAAPPVAPQFHHTTSFPHPQPGPTFPDPPFAPSPAALLSRRSVSRRCRVVDGPSATFSFHALPRVAMTSPMEGEPTEEAKDAAPIARHQSMPRISALSK
jgi:hypothetical protein